MPTGYPQGLVIRGFVLRGERGGIHHLMFVGKLLMWLLINASWNDKTDAGEQIYEDVRIYM